MATKRLEIIIAGDAKGAQRALGAVDKKAGILQSTFVKVGLAAAGVFAIKFGTDAVKAAAADEQAQSKLAQTLEKTAGARKSQVEGVEKWITAEGKAVGVTDDDLRPALARAATAMGSVSGAQKLVSEAMDVAAATGKPLATVTAALAKAHDGQTGALSRLGIQVKDASGKTLSYAQIQDELNKKFGGAAANAADTTAGKYKIFSTRMGELKESIGSALLPVLSLLAGVLLDTVVPALEGSIKWAGDHKAILIAVGAALTPLVALYVAHAVATKVSAAATAISSAATGVATAAQWALNAAMSANPIMLVVLGLGALAVGVKLAYDHFAWFKGAVDTTWQALQTGYSWVTSNWPLLLGVLTGPFGLAVLAITRNWDSLVGFIQAIPGRVGGALSSMWDGMKSGFRAAINWVIEKWNAFKIPAVKVLGIQVSPQIDFPNIKPLAAGGIVTRPTLALVGEAGPEAVIPLSRLSRGTPTMAGRDSTVGDRPVTINVYGVVGDARAVALEIREQLRRLDREAS